MADPAPELPAKDRLLTRPDETPLPAAQDPKAPLKHPTDPKRVPPDGQGTDPKAADLDRSA